ncbi:MAG: aldose epimerase family protein [Chthoniobacterales bacterium]
MLAMMNGTAFGKTGDEAEVSLFSIEHSSGIRVAVTDLGASLVSLEVPDRQGRMGDVILGFSRAEDYAAHADFYFGSSVGRFANRIAHGKFTLGGRVHQLNANNSPGGIPCHLHGGVGGFHSRLWLLEDAGEDYVRFGYSSPDGEEGYPGNLKATVTYRVGPGRQLTWTAEAVADAPTIVNLVHHPYWNLSGGEAPTIDGHVLQLFATSYLPVTDGKIPTGEIRSVSGTPMDFCQPRMIGRETTGHHDHCWVLDRSVAVGDLVLAARLTEPRSGRTLEISTNQPGIQFYDGHSLDGSVIGCEGRLYGSRAGLCLEPQNFPDAPNHPGFPSCRLVPGQVYTNIVAYEFGAG